MSETCASRQGRRVVVRTGVLALAILLLPSTGCVERLLQVRTAKPGAHVYVNGKEAGTTPLEHPFSFYGTVGVVVRQEGYHSIEVHKRLSPPWYEFFPLDFFVENLWPFTVKDHHVLEIELEPLPGVVREEEWEDLRHRAESARDAARRVENDDDEAGNGDG